MTERNGDMSMSGPRRVTVEDASRVLGISESAIRKRIERNTLRSVRENGTRYVLLEDDTIGHDTDTTGHDTDTTADMSTTSTALIDAKDETIAELRSRVESLERQLDARQEEIRRRDHLLAAALERIPELLPPSPPPAPAPHAPQTAADGPEGSEAPPGR
jgi:Tfp pilus assembly protein FimV